VLTTVGSSIRAIGAGRNDRSSATASRDAKPAAVSSTEVAGSNGAQSPPALLQSALEQLRLEGAIFFRAELSEGFSFESTPLALAEALVPGAQRLILFHIVARGTCWVSVADGERHWARQGDVIVVPYGDRHSMGGEAPAESVSILSLLDPPPWKVMPRIRHGGDGARTDLVCGYLYSEHPLFDPAMRALPPAFVVRLPAGTAAGWVQASIAYSLEHAAPSNASSNPISTRLPELVLIEVLQAHLATAPAADRGWMAALRDPVLAPALSLLHSSPDRTWTVADLASGAAVSRSSLSERFRQVLGRSPIRYLTEWRMHLAEDLLATTDAGVSTVARRVGYDSEEAFSRAFKRQHGLSPSHWRTDHAAPSQTGAP
jgi:AraC-like DNA-binding protein